MFGSDVGDSRVGTGDDGSSGEIDLSESFHFFNDVYDDLYVNINGGISFTDSVSSFTPDDFPMEDAPPLIAPYWADVNTYKGGTIWYRESTNQTDLDMATAQITAFQSPKYTDFRATWVFIATWDEVGFYGASYEGRERRCTFQAALPVDAATNVSFVILNYARLEWTAGTASGGTYWLL